MNQSNHSLEMNQFKPKDESELALYSWCDIKTNPYNQGLHPKMFNPNGLVVRKTAKLKGSYPHDTDKDCYIKYDREFVQNKLYRIFKPLLDADFPVELILHECRNACREKVPTNPFDNGEQVQRTPVLLESEDTISESVEDLI